MLQVGAVANPLHQIKRREGVRNPLLLFIPLGVDKEEQMKHDSLLHSLLIKSPQREVRCSHMSHHQLFPIEMWTE